MLLLLLAAGFCQAFRFVEYFCGQGNVTFAMKMSGFASSHFDKELGGRYNNICEPSGMAWPGSTSVWVFVSSC